MNGEAVWEAAGLDWSARNVVVMVAEEVFTPEMVAMTVFVAEFTATKAS